MLKIQRSVYETLAQAARAAAPAEACGLLAGQGDQVTEFYPLTNADASSEHYSMVPSEQFAAVKDMRSRGLTMLAIWHSHPASPPRMSPEDLRLAYTPGVAYVILSLASPAAPEIRGYLVENGTVEEIELSVEDGMQANATGSCCRLPPDTDLDIENHANDVTRFLSGALAPAIFKSRRVPRGIYEQRKDGTFMMRVRVAGGSLLSSQMRTIADLSGLFGNGQLHVTTRQDVQFHDVDIANTPEIMRRLKTVGLSCRGGGGNTVRNVTACPYAGVCPAESFDVTPFAHAVTEYLTALAGSYNLPRKYKIAFSGCGADCALARVNDLGFVAAVRDGQPGFSVYAGGGMGAHSRLADRMEEWIPARDVIRMAEAVRRLFDRLGDRRHRHRARLRFVFDRIGTPAFRDALTKEVSELKREGAPDCSVTTPVRTPDGSARPPLESDALTSDGIRYLPQRQEGFVMVPLHLPLGFISRHDFAKLADLAGRFSAERGLRTTHAQNLLMRFVRPQDLSALATALRTLDTDLVTPALLDYFVSCAGASTCRLGLCLSRNAARACADALGAAAIAGETLGALRIHVSGCSNSCGQHLIAPLGFFGSAQRAAGHLAPSYQVVLGARHGEQSARFGGMAGTVPARALPRCLADLASDFQSGRLAGETFAAYFERKGLEHFKPLVARHAQFPPYSEDPSFYRDWGRQEDFSLAGRGAGECGAGVFEVISGDIAEARKALATAKGKEGALFSALLPAVRALLIVRGVDSRDPDENLRSFEKHFVDTDLVGPEFRGLLSRARGHLQGWKNALDDREDEIRSLLSRVELLYSTLDGDLSFHPPALSAAAGHQPKDAPDAGSPAARGVAPATAELNLRGVACPMNFVKAKLKLETMSVGDTLSMVLDDGEPIQNVPASFRGEGQEVVETTRIADGHWRVQVRKKR